MPTLNVCSDISVTVATSSVTSNDTDVSPETT